MVFRWNNETIEQLKLLHKQNLSASAIASKMGIETRNAVIGKLHRLGLSGIARAEREAIVKAAKPKRKPDKYRTIQSAVSIVHSVKAKIDRPPPGRIRFVSDAADVVPLHIGIFELTSQTCRWPYGDAAPFTFCGCQKISDGPYCYSHSELSKPPALQRKATQNRQAA